MSRRPRTFDPGRRRFITHSVGGALVASVATTGLAVTRAGATTAVLAPGDHVLVKLFLRGGPDGCSLLVPAGDAGYHDRRPTIAVPEAAVVPVDATFGLHPAMAPLLPAWEAGTVAAVPACGSVLGTRSHFEQQAAIEHAGGDDGWLGRLSRQLVDPGGGDGPAFTATAMGGRVPPGLAGADEVVAVADLATAGSVPFRGLDDTGAEEALGTLTASAHPAVAASARTALGALPVLRDVAASAGATDPDRRAGPPTLAATMTDLAALIRADVGVRVVTVDAGGWDTHDAMGDADGGRMADRIADLATGLATFLDELGADAERTTVLAMGEFGRRVAENGSGGTDHGRGGVALVVGGGVRGGRHGDWPGLADDVLDRGDVPVVTDWRAVAAEVVAGPMGADVGAVFPGVDADALAAAAPGVTT